MSAPLCSPSNPSIPLNTPASPTSSSPFPQAEVHKIYLEEGKSLNVESSAMLACCNLDVTTAMNGSLLSVAKRYILGGETLFQNIYSAKKGGGWIALEEAVPGQINSYLLQAGKNLILGRGSYVAADQNITISTDYAGVSSWWKGVGIARLKASVTEGSAGRIFFSSNEGIVKSIQVTEQSGPVIIDNNNIIAYTDDMLVSLRKMGNMRSLLFSGEGTVNEFKGNGVIFLGSGESAARENLLEKIVKIAAESLMPDPVTLINRITLLALIYILINSIDQKNLSASMIELADTIAAETTRQSLNADAGPGCKCPTIIQIVRPCIKV